MVLLDEGRDYPNVSEQILKKEKDLKCTEYVISAVKYQLLWPREFQNTEASNSQ